MLEQQRLVGERLQRIAEQLEHSTHLAPLSDAWNAYRDRLQQLMLAGNRLNKGQEELPGLQQRAASAAQQLAAQGIEATVYSVTSWSELARDGAACQQRALAGETAPEAFIAQQLTASEGPIIAATDYVRAVPESIRAFLPPGRSYLTLGTDGFGRSDTRAALRGFFGVDAASIVSAALHQLSLSLRA